MGELMDDDGELVGRLKPRTDADAAATWGGRMRLNCTQPLIVQQFAATCSLQNRGDRTPVELFAAHIGLWALETRILVSP